MKLYKIAKRLNYYNKWRRDDSDDSDDPTSKLEMPDPKEIGMTIDNAAKALETLRKYNITTNTVERIAFNAYLPRHHGINYDLVIKIAQGTIKTLIKDLENE